MLPCSATCHRYNSKTINLRDTTYEAQQRCRFQGDAATWVETTSQDIPNLKLVRTSQVVPTHKPGLPNKHSLTEFGHRRDMKREHMWNVSRERTSCRLCITEEATGRFPEHIRAGFVALPVWLCFSLRIRQVV